MLSVHKFIEEQLCRGEKVKLVIPQRKYIFLRETVVLTDMRVLVFRSGFLLRIIQDFPYDTVSSIRAENTRPVEGLAAFLFSMVALWFFLANIDLRWIIPTDYPTTVYFSVLSGIISAAVVSFYVYREYGRTHAMVAGGIVFGFLAIVWYFLHYLVPPLKQGALQFIITNVYLAPYYLPLKDIIDNVCFTFGSNLTVVTAIVYGLVALVCFAIRLSLVRLDIEEGWQSITIRPYKPEIIKIIREASKP